MAIAAVKSSALPAIWEQECESESQKWNLSASWVDKIISIIGTKPSEMPPAPSMSGKHCKRAMEYEGDTNKKMFNQSFYIATELSTSCP